MVRVPPDVVRALEAKSDSFTISVVTASDPEVLRSALNAAIEAIRAVEHPEQPGEPFASYLVLGDDGRSVRGDMADAAAYPGTMEEVVQRVVAALERFGITDATVSTPAAAGMAEEESEVPEYASLTEMTVALRDDRVDVQWVCRAPVPPALGPEPSRSVSFHCYVSAGSAVRRLVVHDRTGIRAALFSIDGPGAPPYTGDRSPHVTISVDGNTITASVPRDVFAWDGSEAEVSGRSTTSQATDDKSTAVTVIERARWRSERDSNLRLFPAVDHDPAAVIPAGLAFPGAPRKIDVVRDGRGGEAHAWIRMPRPVVEAYYEEQFVRHRWTAVERQPVEPQPDDEVQWRGTAWRVEGSGLIAVVAVAETGGRLEGTLSVQVQWQPDD